MHVQVADGVLQAGVGAALWDWLGDGVDVELGDLRVVVGPPAGARHPPQLLLFLLHVAANRRTWRGEERERKRQSGSRLNQHYSFYGHVTLDSQRRDSQ